MPHNVQATDNLKRKRFLNEIEEILHHFAEEGIPVIPPFQAAPLSFWEKLAERLTGGVGSWPFTIFLAILVTVWFIWNGHPAFAPLHFDEFPFIFLNLALSAMAGFQAPIILMSQNAQYHRDLQREKHRFEVQVITEAEMRATYERLTGIEMDIAVIMQEQNYDKDNMKRDLRDLTVKCDNVIDGLSEYKSRTDKISEDLLEVKRIVDTISAEHIKLIRDLLETIKEQKEESHVRRDRKDIRPGDCGGKPE